MAQIVSKFLHAYRFHITLPLCTYLRSKVATIAIKVNKKVSHLKNSQIYDQAITGEMTTKKYPVCFPSNIRMEKTAMTLPALIISNKKRDKPARGIVIKMHLFDFTNN
jgi:hypothetical protein